MRKEKNLYLKKGIIYDNINSHPRCLVYLIKESWRLIISTLIILIIQHLWHMPLHISLREPYVIANTLHIGQIEYNKR
jgi:hypothetical protein